MGGGHGTRGVLRGVSGPVVLNPTGYEDSDGSTGSAMGEMTLIRGPVSSWRGRSRPQWGGDSL